jgi:predicted nicotinamide N-methyase
MLGAEVLCTDGDPEIMTTASNNIASNLSRYQALQPAATIVGRAAVAVLPWGASDQTTASAVHAAQFTRPGAPDILLAADVIYGGNSAVWHLFIESLATLAGPETIVLLELTERVSSTSSLLHRGVVV